MSTLDHTKKKSKSSRKKEDVQPPPFCSSVKKETKNKLYSKMKHKLEDVSVVLGFNTARGEGDEVSLDGTKMKRCKSNKLTVDDPERLDKAVAEILNSRGGTQVPAGNSRNHHQSQSKKGSRTTEFKKSKTGNFGLMSPDKHRNMNSDREQDAGLQVTDEGAEPSAEEEDLKDVVCVLQEQVTLKTKEINDLRAYIIALKEEHTAYSDKLELEIADYKIKYAQYKQSIQDYESFIEELQK